MSLYPDTHAMRSNAARLSAQAEHVRTEASAVRTVVAAVRWRGPAATVFEGRVASLYAAFCTTAGELDDAAQALRAHADAVDAEVHRLLSNPRADAEFLLDPTHGLASAAAGALAHGASSVVKTVEGWL
jgi:uncharacterized protein YukE